MGGILTLLTLFTLRREAVSGESAVSNNNQPVSSLTPATTTENSKSSASAVSVAPMSLAANASLFAYIPKPANSAQLENEYVAPSHDIHYARVDEIASGDHSPLSRVGGRVELKLPDGTTLPIVVQNTESFGASRFVSDGEIEGSRGHASFAYNDGELSGTIDINDGAAWQIRAIGGSVAQVFQVDSALVPPCGDAGAVHASQPTVAAAGANIPESEATAGEEVAGDIPTSLGALVPALGAALAIKSTVRVLVPYSQAITKTISATAVVNAIDLAVANLNTDLQRSAVPVKVVLAGTPSENYTYDGKDPATSAIDNALTRITSPADGVLDHIHAVRYDTQADLVCFTINEVDSTNSGIGYILATPNSAFNCTYGFSVISFSYLNSARTFSHELGHNFGCNHDRQNATAVTGTYAYSYGFRFYGKNNQQYRTIMSYPPGQVIAYFSNPNLTAPSPLSVIVGAKTGTSTQAYNALTITQNATEVSTYHTNRLVVRAASMTRTKS